jgi:hypothetical protein
VRPPQRPSAVAPAFGAVEGFTCTTLTGPWVRPPLQRGAGRRGEAAGHGQPCEGGAEEGKGGARRGMTGDRASVAHPRKVSIQKCGGGLGGGTVAAGGSDRL